MQNNRKIIKSNFKYFKIMKLIYLLLLIFLTFGLILYCNVINKQKEGKEENNLTYKTKPIYLRNNENDYYSQLERPKNEKMVVYYI